MIDTVSIACASCGEEFEIGVDPSGGRRQRLIEDCWVCCRPNVIEVILDPDGELESLSVAAE